MPTAKAPPSTTPPGPSVKPPTDSSTDAVWYRQWIEVPKTLTGYDLTGARIWFQFRANANGPMPEIIYFNGRRVALGDDLEPIVLFDDAKPGDRVLVAVKLLATVDKKTLPRCAHEDRFLRQPPQSRRRAQGIHLRRSARPQPVYKRLGGPGHPPTKPSPHVDLSALDAANQQKFDASLKQAQSTLEALRPMLQQATLHLTGNSHIDAAWLWPWTETVDVVKRTFSTALQLMNEYPNYTYTQSAAALQRVDRREIPADQRPDQAAHQGRPLGDRRRHVGRARSEHARRRIDRPLAAHRQALVPAANTASTSASAGIPTPSDTTGRLPQIYKKSGVDYFVTQKMDVERHQ